METIQQKRERRSELARQARNLVDTVKGADWKAEHGTQFDNLTADIERIDGEISRAQKVMDMDADRNFRDAGMRGHDDQPANERKIIDAKWLRGGDNALNASEWAVVRNTMSTTTPSEGGYTVRTDVATSVVEAMKAFGGMREVSTIISTDQGNPMQWPTSNGTAEVGEIRTQNEAATDLDPSFGVKDLPVFKYSSKVIAVPIELLQDSNVDIEAFVRGRIAQRIGRITNLHYTTGGGSTLPTGIATAAATGVTAASPTVFTYEELLDLQHSVDPSYRGNAKFMMNDGTLKQIRKLKDDDGRPLFLPSYDAGIRGGIPAELMGQQIVINQDVAALGAGNKAMLYGDFSYYIIRDVMALTLLRFDDSAYAKKGQVGFLAWFRTGGNFVDVGGAVKALVCGAGGS